MSSRRISGGLPRTTMTLTAAQQTQLFAHLFPGDGKEAAAVLVCTRVPGARLTATVWLRLAAPALQALSLIAMATVCDLLRSEARTTSARHRGMFHDFQRGAYRP